MRLHPEYPHKRESCGYRLGSKHLCKHIMCVADVPVTLLQDYHTDYTLSHQKFTIKFRKLNDILCCVELNDYPARKLENVSRKYTIFLHWLAYSRMPEISTKNVHVFPKNGFAELRIMWSMFVSDEFVQSATIFSHNS